MGDPLGLSRAPECLHVASIWLGLLTAWWLGFPREKVTAGGVQKKHIYSLLFETVRVERVRVEKCVIVLKPLQVILFSVLLKSLLNMSQHCSWLMFWFLALKAWDLSLPDQGSNLYLCSGSTNLTAGPPNPGLFLNEMEYKIKKCPL